MTETAELKSLLDFAVRLAREAGGITQRYFKSSLTLERKADNSLVTIADREAERHIRESIEQTFPDDGFLGEEEEERAGKSGRRWIIDPLDGTFSFVHGVPLYGVMIGLEIEAKPALGVVNLPAINEIAYAARGQGCFLNSEPVGSHQPVLWIRLCCWRRISERGPSSGLAQPERRCKPQ